MFLKQLFYDNKGSFPRSPNYGKPNRVIDKLYALFFYSLASFCILLKWLYTLVEKNSNLTNQKLNKTVVFPIVWDACKCTLKGLQLNYAPYFQLRLEFSMVCIIVTKYCVNIRNQDGGLWLQYTPYCYKNKIVINFIFGNSNYIDDNKF